MDEKTARKYRHLGKLPSEIAKPHDWATRPNPFGEVWGEVLELLAGNPGLKAKTIFGELQRRHPGCFADNQLRTLQRHIKVWRATSGPPKEVFFTQVHEPGRLGASDFTSIRDYEPPRTYHQAIRDARELVAALRDSGRSRVPLPI